MIYKKLKIAKHEPNQNPEEWAVSAPHVAP